MIRFHSFYPWHTHGTYTHLCNDKDLQMLPWVKEFKYVLFIPQQSFINIFPVIIISIIILFIISVE